MSLKIKNNLIAGAEVELSPNSSDRHDEIDLIVLHCISLPGVNMPIITQKTYF